MLYSLRLLGFISWIVTAALIWEQAGGRTYAQSVGKGDSARVMREFGPAGDELKDSRFDDLLAEARDLLLRARASVDVGSASVDQQGTVRSASTPAITNGSLPDALQKLVVIRERLVEEDKKVRAYLERLDKVIQDKNLSPEFADRHQTFARDYTAKYEALMASLDDIETAHTDATGLWAKLTGRNKKVDWDVTIGKAVNFFKKTTPQPQRSSLNPSHLPFRSLKADKPIPPKLTQEEWLQAFPARGFEKGTASAALSEVSTRLSATAPPASADLAETIEVKFTPEIRQLANSLAKNPVKIFNWVRNNIEFVPTWGSIQGSQLCMENRAGNAFDTASLLIALLRYSGIPARYQMGTIEVPIENAKNWLGGFSDARAAARFAASGGVPSAGIVEQNGALQNIRLEHVWVFAYVDYVPSGGAIQFAGDTWVSLDPSFKLYDRLPGEDLAAKLGFNVAPAFQHLDTTTTFGARDGSVTNIDTAFVERTYQELAEKVKAEYPSGDPRPAFRPPAVRKRELPIVPAALPYRVLLPGPSLASLPASLRHSLTLWLSDELGTKLMEFQAALPEISDKTISLFYEPATQSDVSLIRAAAPPNIFVDKEFGTLVPRIMQGLPAELVRVRPVIQTDGVRAAAGSPVGMGRTLTLSARFDAPTITTPVSTLVTVAWGRYGITLDLAGISTSGLQYRVASYQQLTQQLSRPESTEMLGVVASVPQDLIVRVWFNQVDDLTTSLGRAARVAFARYPSLGFSYHSYTVTKLFGMPIKVAIQGFVIDIARQFQVLSALTGDRAVEPVFNLQVGFISSLLEGIVAAEFFKGPKSHHTGISTSSALWAAAQQGIPIHLLNPSNLQVALPLLDDGYDKESLENWVNTGREVLVAQRPPSIDGSPVFGYAAIDLTTGDGAFIVNDAGAGWLRFICADALVYEDCAKWFLTFMDVLLVLSIAVLVAFALPAISALLDSLAATLTAMAATILGPIAFSIVGIGSQVLLLVAGCFDAAAKGNPLTCFLKDFPRFIFFLRTGMPAPF